MDVLSNLFDGLVTVASPVNLLLLLAGVLVGMVIGIIPGLGPSAGIAILLPLTFGLDPTGAIVMLAAIYYGAMYGGTITSVLINTPGESATVASTFDGYPLAKQGRAGPALVLCALGSFAAGVMGAVLLSWLAPAFSQVARRFGPPELFLVVMLGLLMLVVIVGGNRLYGSISALIGFAVATMGVDSSTGAQRYTFGSTDLINGIDFIPIAIGLFGIGELLHSLYQGQHREETRFVSVDTKSASFWPTARDWVESRGSMLRGSVLGFVMGVIPGAGATIASLMSYSMEKSVSSTPERFGKGAMAGLVGPESANNAASAGAMVPLITLGIPGSASTAVLLAAFLLYGLRPGPLLIEQNPEFVWGLIASMFAGNMMLVLLNIFAIPVFASFMKIPYRIVIPTVIVLCTVGTYTVNGSIVETWIMLGFGVVGFFMKRFGFSPAATVVALVLGPLAEETLRQSLTISRGSFAIFVNRPVSLGLLMSIILLIVAPLLWRLFGPKRPLLTAPAEAQDNLPFDSDAG
ncbi:MAG: tripartite tricarboxylate transporter permease [Nitriliruptorales bacterium]|nr:tripartite tricarboxylate transporter permease [Nitriliruptorales bacterium]